MIRLGPASPRRSLIRALVKRLGDDRDSVCLADMEAERVGRVARPRGAEDLTPGTRAKALRSEGKRAGRFDR